MPSTKNIKPADMENSSSKSDLDIYLQAKRRLAVISIVISVLFGLVSGVIGVLFILSGSLDQNSFFSNFSLETILPEQRVIIKQQQAVTVSKDEQLAGLSVKIKPTIATLVKLKSTRAKDLAQVYTESDIIGFGFTLTSDGWISFHSSVVDRYNLGDLAVLINGGDMYMLESLVVDDLSSIGFAKINADNLLVASLVSEFEFTTGQTLVSVARSLPSGRATVEELLVNQYIESDLVNSSESNNRQVLVSGTISKTSQPVFSLSGEVTGFLVPQKNEMLLQPIVIVNPILSQVLKDKSIERAYLGIEWVALDGNFGLADKYRQGLNKGALVWQVEDKSPAFNIGIKKGDVINRVNDIGINSRRNLSEMIQSFSAEDTVFLQVIRGEKTLEFEVKLKENQE